MGVIQEYLLKPQELSILYKRKGRRLNGRPPWLKSELLGVTKCKKTEAYQLWKETQIAIEDYKILARACRNAVRNARSQPNLKLAKDVKYRK